jgi:hypothetical protein
MAPRVRPTDISPKLPGSGGVAGASAKDDTHTIVSGAKRAFIPQDAEETKRVKLSGKERIASRLWVDPHGDDRLKRHMTEVLVRALGVAMAQIDEPKEESPAPDPKRS